MIGTNDIISNYQLYAAHARLDTIIRRMLSATSGHLIVSSIPPTPLPIANGKIQTLNAAIPAIVDSYKVLGKRISYIDIKSMMGSTDISDDSYHPNNQGYEKIGYGRYDAVINFITDVEEGNSYESTPNKYGLHQNYPNPFNPGTLIRYDIPQNTHVLLRVFDSLGRELETLVDNEQPDGHCEILFNAEKYSSGVYFYTLQTENFINTRKMILIR